ncbi:glycosyltransferase family 2 protein [Arthrobacter sp. SX1312]|uniref:glycosyltransferase family 2 protein n=1 Tax=Arthrobacter sp. SX1312 TaxID=2058896 RepID=UPI000CE53360|nr:glycosyltransferase family 2 protein [Arthrobacter sp. SX1312]
MLKHDYQAQVAIIMRTKNRGTLLERAVTDVLAQTYRNWFLVIVNDGGVAPDVERVVARHSARLADSVLVLHNPTSLGMEAASNLGIRACDSTFIAIHDDDDEWRPDFLATTVDYLESSDDEGVMVRTEVVYEEITGSTIEVVGREILEPELTRITLSALIHHNRGVPISFLYRRRAHDEIGFYDEALEVVGDWEFHLRFARRYSIGFIDGEPRAYWNQRLGVSGDLGNSVLDRAEDHRGFDELVRENYLKQDVADHGLGMMMYASSMHRELLHTQRQIQDQLHQQGHRLMQLEAAVSDASLVSLLRRRYRRLKDRFAGRSVPPVGG